MRMMREISSVLSLVILLSCGGKAEQHKRPESATTSPVGTDGDSETGSTEEPGHGVDLSLLQNAGSETRLLEAHGLQVYYSRIFKPKSYGYEHCSKNRPSTSSDCTTTIFTAAERANMGSTGMFATRFSNRGTQNINPIATVTLGYTRTLRAALSRECTKLVTDETAALSPNNILVKASAPTEAHVEDFMKTLLGMKTAPFSSGIPAALYATAFTAAIDGAADPVKAKKNAYINLCISLAMDPSVFIY
jgi:hypothetical protein